MLNRSKLARSSSHHDNGGTRAQQLGQNLDVPWRRWNPLLDLFSVRPTFAVTELVTRVAVVAAYVHARRTGNEHVLMSAVAAVVGKGWFNRVFLNKVGLRFDGQACFMLDPRLSLHSMEYDLAMLYCASVAARQYGLLAIPQAALAGLLALLLNSVYQINGPRFVWWSWHDSDPLVERRIFNAPFGTLMWDMAFASSFSLIQHWMFNPRALVHEGVKSQLVMLEEHHQEIMGIVANVLDSFHQVLMNSPRLARIVAVGLLTSPLISILTGLFQIGSLDKPTVPTQRGFKFMVSVFAFVTSAGFDALNGEALRDTSEAIRSANDVLLGAIAAHFATQVACSVVGEPEKHVSTTVQQPYGKPEVYTIDSLGNVREEFLSSPGPYQNSAQDYTVEGTKRYKINEELKACKEELENLRLFMDRNQADIQELARASSEAEAFQASATERLESSVGKRKAGLGNIIQKMEESTSSQVHQLVRVVQFKINAANAIQQSLVWNEQRLVKRIEELEKEWVMGSLDAAGQSIIPAHDFGPGSQWYTIRGKRSSHERSEKATVCVLGLMGLWAFTKSLTR